MQHQRWWLGEIKLFANFLSWLMTVSSIYLNRKNSFFSLISVSSLAIVFFVCVCVWLLDFVLFYVLFVCFVVVGLFFLWGGGFLCLKCLLCWNANHPALNPVELTSYSYFSSCFFSLYPMMGTINFNSVVHEGGGVHFIYLARCRKHLVITYREYLCPSALYLPFQQHKDTLLWWLHCHFRKRIIFSVNEKR